MSSQATRIYLSLGSNMGNRQGNLNRALDMLSQRVRLGKVSSVYETDPVDNINQPRFLNLACEAYTRLEPPQMLALSKGIESKMGRTGKTKEPRPIDIDILLYGDQIIDTPDLVIPHPLLHERAFVLIPLAEIAPETVHPGFNKTILTLKETLTTPVQGVFKWEGEQESV
ncbi:2-amino-4-hydroxy-6-hydroxymethyldihydropteridine diphosphokinase [Chloroflexota bacterium]